MDMKKAYKEKMQAQLDEWTAEIDKLKARARGMEADAQISSMKEIDALRAKRDAAAEKLEQLERAGDEAWEDLKSGVERAWDAMASSVNSASARFK